jgi:hypothetical protein
VTAAAVLRNPRRALRRVADGRVGGRPRRSMNQPADAIDTPGGVVRQGISRIENGGDCKINWKCIRRFCLLLNVAAPGRDLDLAHEWRPTAVPRRVRYCRAGLGHLATSPRRLGTTGSWSDPSPNPASITTTGFSPNHNNRIHRFASTMIKFSGRLSSLKGAGARSGRGCHGRNL